eukprot:ANDGO_02878.mRNA.1 hypothetical protein
MNECFGTRLHSVLMSTEETVVECVRIWLQPDSAVWTMNPDWKERSSLLECWLWFTTLNVYLEPTSRQLAILQIPLDALEGVVCSDEQLSCVLSTSAVVAFLFEPKMLKWEQKEISQLHDVQFVFVCDDSGEFRSLASKLSLVREKKHELDEVVEAIAQNVQRHRRIFAPECQVVDCCLLFPMVEISCWATIVSTTTTTTQDRLRITAHVPNPIFDSVEIPTTKITAMCIMDHASRQLSLVASFETAQDGSYCLKFPKSSGAFTDGMSRICATVQSRDVSLEEATKLWKLHSITNLAYLRILNHKSGRNRNFLDYFPLYPDPKAVSTWMTPRPVSDAQVFVAMNFEVAPDVAALAATHGFEIAIENISSTGFLVSEESVFGSGSQQFFEFQRIMEREEATCYLPRWIDMTFGVHSQRYDDALFCGVRPPSQPLFSRPHDTRTVDQTRVEKTLAVEPATKSLQSSTSNQNTEGQVVTVQQLEVSQLAVLVQSVIKESVFGGMDETVRKHLTVLKSMSIVCDKYLENLQSEGEAYPGEWNSDAGKSAARLKTRELLSSGLPSIMSSLSAEDIKLVTQLENRISNLLKETSKWKTGPDSVTRAERIIDLGSKTDLLMGEKDRIIYGRHQILDLDVVKRWETTKEHAEACIASILKKAEEKQSQDELKRFVEEIRKTENRDTQTFLSLQFTPEQEHIERLMREVVTLQNHLQKVQRHKSTTSHLLGSLRAEISSASKILTKSEIDMTSLPRGHSRSASHASAGPRSPSHSHATTSPTAYQTRPLSGSPNRRFAQQS